MKKSIFTIAILFSLFSLSLSSCDKGDGGIDDGSAKYQLLMEGNIVAEGTSTNKIMMLNNMVNLGGTGSEVVINITNVPVTVGADIVISESSGANGDKCQLSISGNNLLENGADEMYWGMSGTVTRTSETKISFDGVVKADASGTITHTFSGYVESDTYEIK